MNYAESVRGKTSVPSRVNAVGESFQEEYRRMGQLEKEDIIILFLSVILIIATIWLATRVL